MPYLNLKYGYTFQKGNNKVKSFAKDLTNEILSQNEGKLKNERYVGMDFGLTYKHFFLEVNYSSFMVKQQFDHHQFEIDYDEVV